MAKKLRLKDPTGKVIGVLNIPEGATDAQIQQAAEIALNKIVGPDVGQIPTAQIEGAQEKESFFGGLPSKVSRGAGTVAQVGLETLALPFELAGEAVRLPAEFGFKGPPKGQGFRAPSLFQRFAPSLKTEERPSIGFDVANKLIRAGAAFASRLPKGVEAAEDAAKQAFQAERGVLGTVEDTALGLLAGKLPFAGTGTTLAGAPVKATAEVIKRTAGAAGRGVKTVGKGAIRTAFGPTGKQQSLLFRRPEAVRGARDFGDLSDELANTANSLEKRVEALDDLAWDQLLKLKAEPRSKILNALRSAKKEFAGPGKIGDADRRAIAQIDKYIDRVKGIRQPGVDPKLEQMLDQTQLRDIVQSIRRDTNFGAPNTDPVNRAVQSAQGKINKLLQENGNFAEVMDDLRPATRSLKEITSKFTLRRDPQLGFVPTDATASKLSALKGSGLKKKPQTKKILETFKKQTGKDFADEVQLTEAKEAFEPGERARGSARTLLGLVGGTVLEPIIPGVGVGPLIGATAGRVADVFGGPASGSIVNLLRSVSKTPGAITSALPGQSQTPLLRLLQQAISQGRAAPLVAATR